MKPQVLLELVTAVFLLANALVQDAAAPTPHESPTFAVAVLSPSEGRDVHGVVFLKQEGESVQLTGEVRGLTPGEHGFHIHEFGDLRAPDGTSAGNHFNPTGAKHGGPDSDDRHVGDFGNITANSAGVAKVQKTAPHSEVHMLLGRSIVVHADPDDLTSQPSGNAGARVAVGVIGVGNEQLATRSTATAPRETESQRAR